MLYKYSTIGPVKKQTLVTKIRSKILFKLLTNMCSCTIILTMKNKCSTQNEGSKYAV